MSGSTPWPSGDGTVPGSPDDKAFTGRKGVIAAGSSCGKANASTKAATASTNIYKGSRRLNRRTCLPAQGRDFLSYIKKHLPIYEMAPL